MAAALYRRDIDGLRAIAVLAVIANHFAATLLPGGYLGVDIFFVISGFVITRSLLDRSGRAGLGGFLMAFYARRAKRLLPALIVCVVVTSLLIGLVNPDPGGTLRAGAFALFGLSNYAMLQAGADYFSPSAELNGLLHTWSLGVEEQFYFVFPLIGWIVLFRDPTPRRRTAFLAILTLAAALSLGAWYLAVNTEPMRAFYLSHLRFWELAAGCILALLMRRDGSPTSTTWPWQAAALAAIGVLLVTPAAFEWIATPAIVVATAVAIRAGNTGRAMDRLLTAPTAVWLGAISYSLYLWHWPVIVFSRWTIGIHWWSWPLQLAAIFALAQLSFSTIENPLRKRRWTSRPWSDFAMGMSAAGVAAALVLALAFPLYGKLFVGQRADLKARDAASLVRDYAVPGTRGVWHGPECVLRSATETGKSIEPRRCTLGDPATAGRRVLVVGNSHAAAYVHGFDRLVRDDGYAVTVTSSFGGAPLPGLKVNPAWRSSSDFYWNTLVPRLAAGLRRGDALLVVSDLAWLSPGPWERDEAGASAADVRKALETLKAPLARRGISLAVIDGVPFVRDAGCTPDAAMPQWFRMGANPCTFYSRAETRRRRGLVRGEFESFAARGDLTLIDVFDVFCPGRVCTYRASDGRILYRDEHSHPSLEAMGLVAPIIRQALL